MAQKMYKTTITLLTHSTPAVYKKASFKGEVPAG